MTPRLLVVFTGQLEILVTSLQDHDITTHSHLGITYTQMDGQKRGLSRIREIIQYIVRHYETATESALLLSVVAQLAILKKGYPTLNLVFITAGRQVKVYLG